MVTGSHIPDDRNGIKFNKPDGEVLKADEAGIREQTVSVPLACSMRKVFHRAAATATRRRFGLPTLHRALPGFFPAGCLAGSHAGLRALERRRAGDDQRSSAALAPTWCSAGIRNISSGRYRGGAPRTSPWPGPGPAEAFRPAGVRRRRRRRSRWCRDEHGNWLRGDVCRHSHRALFRCRGGRDPGQQQQRIGEVRMVRQGGTPPASVRPL